MPQAATNRTQLAYRRYDNAGVQIGIAGEFQEVPVRSDGLNHTTETVLSETIRSDRQNKDVIRTFQNIAGALGFEMFARGYDDLIAAALESDGWSGEDVQHAGTDVETVVTLNVYRTTVDGGFAIFAVGDMIKVAGFTDADNNGYARITAIGDYDYGGSEVNNEITVTGLTLTTEAAGDSVTIDTQHQVASVSGITYSCVASGNEIRSTVNGDFEDFVAGCFIKVTGFTESANNGYFRVASVGDHDFGGSEVNNKLVVEETTLADEAAGDTVTIEPSSFATNGTTLHEFDFERGYLDITQYSLFSGIRLDQMSLNIAARQIVTGEFTAMGETEARDTSTVITSKLDAPDDPVINAIDHVFNIVEGGGQVGTTIATEFGFQLANNLRERAVIGQDGPISYGDGKCEPTGTLRTYFEDTTYIDKYLAFSQSSLFIFIEDANGYMYMIEIPALRYTQANNDVPGQNDDVMVDMTWAAFLDNDNYGYTVRVHRWDVNGVLAGGDGWYPGGNGLGVTA